MSNINEIFTGKIAEKLKSNPDLASSINATYVFDLGDEGGMWSLDLTKPGGEVKEGAIDDPNLTVTMKADDFVKLVDGSLNAQMAFMSGKLKIKGDMPLALKLQSILS
ncbi:MAG: SCP2 sterol-binding domain-containing protein [Myxococcota bacterium]